MGYFTKIKYAAVLLNVVVSSVFASQNEPSDAALYTLSIENAVLTAQTNDPWLVGNQHSQDAIESMSIAASTLPDPKMSIGLGNIAADSFDFNQEPMSQFKVEVSQMFPRGDSLELKKKQLQLTGSQYPFQRKDRKAKVAVTAANLWLDAYKAQQSIVLIEKNRPLFEQLADVAEASYSSTIGRTRQQDIVRAQLELTRLDDRLSQLKQQQEMAQQRLSEWLREPVNYRLSSELPNIILHQETPVFAQHPSVKALDQKIKASSSDIDLAKQKYQPQWGVNVGYGYRDAAPNGIDRSDLFSIGVSFDIPLFTANRQDKEVQSAVSKTAAVKTEKWLLIQNLTAAYETNRAQFLRLNERQQLYKQRLLPQIHDQAEASLTAYTNDYGEFSEVVRARIAELNAELDALSIDVDRQKNIIQLNYFFSNSDEEKSNG